MPINIEEFKGKLIYGGARSNLFKVRLQFPTRLTGAQGVARDAEFLVRAASLPGVNLAVIEVPYQGRIVKVHGNRSFDEWETTIYNDEPRGGIATIRDALFQWHNEINGYENNISNTVDTSNIVTTYKADVQVFQLSKDGSLIRGYTMVGCWPTVVSPIDVSWDQTTEIQQYTVTWAYDYWVPSETAAPGVGGTISPNDFTSTINT